MSVGAARQLGASAATHGHAAAVWLSDGPSIEVVAVRHPILEALGHDPTSEYAEQFWLPTIGPSALWTHRRLNAGFVGGRNTYSLDLAALGREIGLGGGTGRNSMIVRTVTRLLDFHLAEIVDGRLGVSTMLPPLSRRQAIRLPEHLASRHQELARSGSRHSATSPTRTRVTPKGVVYEITTSTSISAI